MIINIIPAPIPEYIRFFSSLKLNCRFVIISNATIMMSFKMIPKSRNMADLKPLLMLVCINVKKDGPNPRTVASVRPIIAPSIKTICQYFKDEMYCCHSSSLLPLSTRGNFVAPPIFPVFSIKS